MQGFEVEQKKKARKMLPVGAKGPRKFTRNVLPRMFSVYFLKVRSRNSRRYAEYCLTKISAQLFAAIASLDYWVLVGAKCGGQS